MIGDRMRSGRTPGHDADDHARRVAAWIGYDLARSAFATVVASVVLPLTFVHVAASTLPSPGAATRWLSIVGTATLAVVAVVAPLLGAWVDRTGAHIRMLAVLVGLGAGMTSALWFVTPGRWLVALVVFGLARLSFDAGNVLYDSLLPTVSRPDDRGAVSAGGYAAGHLGGAMALTLAALAIWGLPDDVSSRWVFAGVGVWWFGFSLALLRTVAPPPGRRVGLREGPRDLLEDLWKTTMSVAQDPRRRRVAASYVVGMQGIGVVVVLVTLHGRELGFALPMLVGALLLVQVVGVPFTIAFGRLATVGSVRRGSTAGAVVATLVLVPIVGIGLALLAPATLVGRPGPAFEASNGRVGQGEVLLAARGSDQVRPTQLAPDLFGADEPVPAVEVEGSFVVAYNGGDVRLVHAVGPEQGRFEVLLDGAPAVDPDGEVIRVDASADRRRFGNELVVAVPDPGAHELVVRTLDGAVVVTTVEVMPPRRVAAWWFVGAVLVGTQGAALVVASLLGRRVRPWADRLDERGLAVLGLTGFAVVAAWGFRLDTVVELWALAWTLAVVLGGTQAVLRAWFSSIVPPRRAGAYFGITASLIGVASFVVPMVVVVSAPASRWSRPAAIALAGVFLVALALVRGAEPVPREDSDRGEELGPGTDPGGAPRRVPGAGAERLE